MYELRSSTRQSSSSSGSSSKNRYNNNNASNTNNGNGVNDSNNNITISGVQTRLMRQRTSKNPSVQSSPSYMPMSSDTLFAPQPRRVASPELILCGNLSEIGMVTPEYSSSESGNFNSSSVGGNRLMWDTDDDGTASTTSSVYSHNSTPVSRSDNPLSLDSKFNSASTFRGLYNSHHHEGCSNQQQPSSSHSSTRRTTRSQTHHSNNTFGHFRSSC